MPEILEVELYRKAAERAVGRTIAEVTAPDAWYVKGRVPASALSAELVGRTVTEVRRRGKLLLLDTADEGPVLGLRFGMTGRLVVDGVAPIDRLLYAAGAADPMHDRFAVRFASGGDLRMIDPRRLGGVELDPDEARLGPDASYITVGDLEDALGSGTQALKSRLLDQARVAGIGNLLADEVLWRAGLAPARAVGSLDRGERRSLHRHLRATLEELGQRGGSHTGDLMAQRHPGGVCPRDGAPLRRDTIGGRTSWWCPVHQR